ncbi:MAG TPA: hypothetical protein PKA64_02175, partial [Myxococcota bacterium]|nr:hypothetical protein [Myxococcota bacterium]
EGDDLARAVAALREALGYRSLSVDRVDGLPARDHPEVARLLAAGFQRDFKGLVLTRATG